MKAARLAGILLLLFVSGSAFAAPPCRNPTLGVEITNISRSMRVARRIPEFVAGAFVRSVWLGGPASRAGIESGDVIQAVGAELVQNVCGFQSAVGRNGCDPVRLTVRRAKETQAIDVRPEDVTRYRLKKTDDATACRNGDGAACLALARAASWSAFFLRQACDLGEGEGCYELALHAGVDAPAAVGPYQEACDAGIAKACTNLGFMYENGKGVPVDLEAAARLYRLGCNTRACGAPNILGCVNLGRSYRDGIGVKEDQVEATRLFRSICEKGSPDADDAEDIARACSNAGTRMVSGKGTSPDIAGGLRLLEKGCAAQDTLGCFNLGVFYEFGEEVPMDKKRASGYYKQACDRGDKEACERGAQIK
jgi:TPR repeat protein